MSNELLPDDLWNKIEPLLPRRNQHQDRHAGGRPRTEDRKALTGIIFVLRTGVPWRALPRTPAWPSGHTCRRRLLKWHRAGVWQKLFHILLSELRANGKLDWRRAIVDSGSVRAPSGGWKTGPSPTDRRKLGTKHHVITDAKGTPLAILITGANRHDITQLLPLVEAIEPVAGKKGRPRSKPKVILGDRGYDSEPHRQVLKKNGNQIQARKKANKTRIRTREKTIRG